MKIISKITRKNIILDTFFSLSLSLSHPSTYNNRAHPFDMSASERALCRLRTLATADVASAIADSEGFFRYWCWSNSC